MSDQHFDKRIIFPTFVIALGGLLFGYDTGVISGALPAMQEHFQLTPFTSGVVVSALVVGAAIGALSSGRISDRFGRRPVLLLASVIFIVGTLLAALSPSVPVIVGARVVLGLAIGLASSVVPVFISEMAPAGLRGRLVSMNQLMIVVGILLAYLANYALHGVNNDWRWMIGLALVPSIIFGIGMFFLSESPRWLAVNSRIDEARTVLLKLRPGDQVEAELREIRAVEEQDHKSSSWAALADPSLRRVLIAGVGLQILGQLTGVNAVVYYAPSIFESAGLGRSSALLATVGIGVINLVATVVGMSLVDRVGRTKLLAVGSTITAVSLLLFAYLVMGGTPSGTLSWLGVACIFIYIFGVAVGLCIVVFIIPSELYPIRVRGTAMSLTLACNWTMSFIVSLTFLSLFDAFGSTGTFGIYGLVCLALVVFALKVIPETKGRSLEEIEQEYVNGIRR